jgi:hypothetical protein
MDKYLCIVVYAVAVVALFAWARARRRREDDTIRGGVRREWHAKVARGGVAFDEGDRVRVSQWRNVEDLARARGTVVGVAQMRTDDGFEGPVYWVALDAFVRDFGPNAKPLVFAPCELEYDR